MSAVLRVGVIGLGFFGARHAAIHAAHPSARLVGICDRDPQVLRALGSRTGARCFTDFHELLALPDLDAVSI
ncbi:Gfo/Idh/MocA family oxidoreductase, partial [Geminicoccus flavidas]|uniref:Gfo/Idh/MocA family oxidoreductase n=1 Tax=Geminicoccus flavidas TaxID=2506407 RepID=UPI001358AD6E